MDACGATSSRTAAAGELKAINRRLFPLWQASYQDEKASWGIVDLKRHVIGDVGTVARLALAAVGLVWLIACANASNLLDRPRHEPPSRAGGAGRARSLARDAWFATCWWRAACSRWAPRWWALALAWVGIGLLRAFGVGIIPRTQEIALDGPVLWLLGRP